MPSPPTRRALLAAAAAAPLVLFAYFAVTLAQVDSQLGYDESVYAVGARGLITGVGMDDFPIYRPIGMRVLAAPGWLAGGTPGDFRVCAAIYATLCLIAVWGLGRRLVGTPAATVAVAVVTTSVEVQLRASELLSDFPSLALIFLLIWIVVRELEREGGPGWLFLAAGPLAALSFYIRYGSTMILLAIAAAATIVYWPVVRRAAPRVAATAGVFALCMIPHLLHASSATGGALGIVRAANRAAGRRYYGEGLWYLYRHFPDKPGGLILAVVALIGIGSGLVHLIRLRRQRDTTHRLLGFAWLAATLHTLAVGFDVHGQPRFVFFGMFLYTLLGAHALVRLVDGADRRRLLEVVIPAALVVWLIAREGHRDAIAHNQRDRRAGVVLRATADVVLADSAGGSCAIMSPLVPQMTWLTGCAPHSTTSRTAPEVLARMRAGGREHLFVVMFTKTSRTPEGERLADIMAEVELPPLAEIKDEAGVLGDATIYRVK